LERRTKRDRLAQLTVVTVVDGPTERDIHACVTASNDGVAPRAVAYRRYAKYRRLAFDIEWRARPAEAWIPSFVDELARTPGVLKVDWHPQ
jgi:hypothetical protein